MKKNKKVLRITLCALFCALTAIGAFIRIPIPMVPITLQYLFTNLAGILLGKKYGAASVALYVVLGLIGLPVFTQGGGPGYIFQPTFGYLLGFIAGTWVTGALAERKCSVIHYTLAGLAGLGVIYLAGMAYYYILGNYFIHSPIGVKSLIVTFCLVSLPGDVVLAFLSGVLCRRLVPILKRNALIP